MAWDRDGLNEQGNDLMAAGSPTPRRVAVTGSSGLLGRSLVESLRRDGQRIHRVVRDRSAAGPQDVFWRPQQGEIDGGGLEGVDAVVHFAGEPLDAGRGGPAFKQRVRDSRVAGTRLLAGTLAALDDPPEVLVSASGSGFYGSRGDEVLTEASGTGDDFMARVCRDWEAATQPAADARIRVVNSRTGVVIAAAGPLIEKVDLPFRLGVGGRVGSGRQWYPWIALEDQVRAVRFVIDHDLAGPVNVAAPEPVTNAQLTQALGEVLRRPTKLVIPTLAIRALYGEMAQILATSSQRALPERLLAAGFEWQHTDVRTALRAALER